MNDFFNSLYEISFHQGNFSIDMYRENLYTPIGLTLIGTILIGLFLYYYVIDHPRFNKWYHWLLTSLLIAIINFSVAFFLAKTELEILYGNMGVDLPFRNEFLLFALQNFIYSIVLSFIVSYSIRWWSNNCSTCPFPN